MLLESPDEQIKRKEIASILSDFSGLYRRNLYSVEGLMCVLE